MFPPNHRCLCLKQPSDVEPTLGERVATLQLEERRRAAALAGEVEVPGDEDSREGDETDVPLKAIKADSLAVLLTQVHNLEHQAATIGCGGHQGGHHGVDAVGKCQQVLQTL
jgi:hypothetical protein